VEPGANLVLVSDDQILVEVYDANASAEDVDRLTRALRGALLGIDDVEAVRPASAGPAPEGSKAVGVEALGALLVAVEPTVEVVRRVLDVVRSWLGHGSAEASSSRTMRVTVNGHTIELIPTPDQQQALVEKFLADAVRPTPGA
jgi:hypothetical protein